MKEKLIFVVDDDKVIRNILEYAFAGTVGYSVNIFAFAEECILNLNKKPDIIIMDHNFIGNEKELMNGLDALVKIREIDALVPVIILSNLEDKDLIRNYFSKGASDYIPKEGYFIDSLLDSMEHVIKKKENNQRFKVL